MGIGGANGQGGFRATELDKLPPLREYSALPLA
jgi:hypothetical protein